MREESGVGRRLEEVMVQNCTCTKWLELSKASRDYRHL